MNFLAYTVLISICFSVAVARSSDVSRLGKLLLLSLMIHFSITAHDSIREVSGYPAVGNLPSDAEVVWGTVWESPDEKFIELWVTFERSPVEYMFSLVHDVSPISRIYRVPYTKDRHRLLLEMQKKIARGERVGIKNDEKISVSISEKDAFIESARRYEIDLKTKKIKK